MGVKLEKGEIRFILIVSQPIKSRNAGGNLFNDDKPIPVFNMESSDFHSISTRTHVVNISPIAVSAQEILPFTRVDGSTCMNMLDLSSRKRKSGQCNRSSNAKWLKYRLYDKKMDNSSYREGDNGLKNIGM